MVFICIFQFQTVSAFVSMHRLQLIKPPRLSASAARPPPPLTAADAFGAQKDLQHAYVRILIELIRDSRIPYI